MTAAPLRHSVGRSFGDRRKEPASWKYVRRVIIAFLCVHVTLALISGYRAVVQIFSLDVRTSSTTLQAGTRVGYRVTTSGRTWATTRLILLQGTRAETLAMHINRGNSDGAYNPFPQHDSMSVMLTAQMLEPFENGPAILRAKSIGASQWLRVPPPTVRDQPVQIVR